MKTRTFQSFLILAASLGNCSTAADLMDKLDVAVATPGPQRVSLTPANKVFLDQRLAAMETQAAKWALWAKDNPDQRVWQELADQTKTLVQTLRTGSVIVEDTSKWISSMIKNRSDVPVAAYVGSTYYIDKTFFSQVQFDSIEAKVGMAAFDSYLMHELIHSRQKGWYEWWGAEQTAYAFQYRYLVASEIPESDTTFGNVLDQLVRHGVLKDRKQRNELDRALGLPSNLSRPSKPADVDLPQPPSIELKEPDDARTQIQRWKEACLAKLDPDKDPQRLANKAEAIAKGDAIHASGEKFVCKNCVVTVTHYWTNSSRWQCPYCEQVTFLVDLRRADGMTYGEFAQSRLRAIEAQRQKVNADADALIAKLRNPR